MMIFFFNDTATTEIYTLSLHDALPISNGNEIGHHRCSREERGIHPLEFEADLAVREAVEIGVLLSCLSPKRSEEHTSELQSRQYLVCRLLLEKKKLTINRPYKATFTRK